MPDDMLLEIDNALASPRRRLRRAPVRPLPPSQEHADGDGDGVGVAPDDRIGWIELFMAVQFLWGVALFVPGAQAIRTVVRAAPYASSAALLGYYFFASLGHRHKRLPAASGLLMAALGLLALNLLHPTSQLAAGVAQCVFQGCIAAPMFWAHKAVTSTRRLDRVILLLFLFNLASAVLGIFQVYLPDRFMPPNFSAQLSEGYLNSLSYIANDGRVIFRPPGLSDQPGGAALAGGLTVLLGLALTMRLEGFGKRVGLMSAVGIGFTVIYLTQVRSVLLMAMGGGVLLAILLIRQGRAAAGTWILASGGAIVVAAFIWASAVGGTSISERFTGLRETGVLQSYQDNRGHYINDTLGNLLDQYPLGAGVGRWGMMNTYFGDGSEPLYVEPQITGWLLDGGLPMWALYGGAVVMCFLRMLRLSAVDRSHVSSAATAVVPVLAFIIGLAMAGPVFNTQMGILFWTLVAAVHGAGIGEHEPSTVSPERSSRSFAGAGRRATRA